MASILAYLRVPGAKSQKIILSCTCAREVRQIVQLLSFSLSSLSFVFFQPSHLRLTG